MLSQIITPYNYFRLPHCPVDPLHTMNYTHLAERTHQIYKATQEAAFPIDEYLFLRRVYMIILAHHIEYEEAINKIQLLEPLGPEEERIVWHIEHLTGEEARAKFKQYIIAKCPPRNMLQVRAPVWPHTLLKLEKKQIIDKANLVEYCMKQRGLRSNVVPKTVMALQVTPLTLLMEFDIVLLDEEPSVQVAAQTAHRPEQPQIIEERKNEADIPQSQEEPRVSRMREANSKYDIEADRGFASQNSQQLYQPSQISDQMREQFVSSWFAMLQSPIFLNAARASNPTQRRVVAPIPMIAPAKPAPEAELVTSVRAWCREMGILSVRGIPDEELLAEFGNNFKARTRKNNHVRNRPSNARVRIVTPYDCYFEAGSGIEHLMIRFYDTAREPHTTKRKLLNLLYEEGLMEVSQAAITSFVEKHSPFTKIVHDKFKVNGRGTTTIKATNQRADTMGNEIEWTRAEMKRYLSGPGARISKIHTAIRRILERDELEIQAI